MICKTCKNDVPDGSIFCNWCGARLVKVKTQKSEITVPSPTKLPSGKWRIQLRAEQASITEETAELCIAKARLIRAGFIERSQNHSSITLREAIDNYIKERNAVLSPSTIRTYRAIQKNRFKPIMDQKIDHPHNWQMIVNNEAKLYHPKTLKTSWMFIVTVLNLNGITVPTVKLPTIPKANKPWLDYTQIPVFIDSIKGDVCELPALLALHSLRQSEVYGLSVDDISLQHRYIMVNKGMVPDEHNNFVLKDTVKNESSQRIVPIMIPRLYELLETELGSNRSGPLVTVSQSCAYKRINLHCDKLGFPKVGFHGLRRSFSSLAQHLGMSVRETMDIGGWSDYDTMQKKYTKVASADISAAHNKMAKFYDYSNK